MASLGEDAELIRICIEIACFSALVLVSEVVRCLVRRWCPKYNKPCLVCSLSLTWYSVSITLVLFNKWIVQSWRNGLMTFPVFYSMTHMFLKGIMASSFIRFVRCKPLPFPRGKIFVGTTIIGMSTGLDVALSNFSFLYVSVSFYTMLKMASLIFILVLGVAAGVEPFSIKICGIVFVITGGIFLTSYAETEFSFMGLTLIIGSEVFAAARWVVTQIVLQDGSLDAMTTVLFMAPASTLSLVPLVFALERDEIHVLNDQGLWLEYAALVLIPGALAFILILVEVSIVKITSSLTLSVIGNLKSLVTILIAVLFFGEHAGVIQWVGLILALSGIFAYSYIKKKKMVAIDSVAFLGYDGLPFNEEDLEDDPDPSNWDEWGAGASAWVGQVFDASPDEILAQAEAIGASTSPNSAKSPQTDAQLPSRDGQRAESHAHVPAEARQDRDVALAASNGSDRIAENAC
eukprot:TRINITY_DN22956_c0_g1_i3.p1 TRINITY_DN22956_c0_g1~~TRINITY_DN22956_c0_g1_i3.p1  ORF type:complete len:468 (+),score=45.49 TRINITY_DN22956_c0_g1_i3:23-1405(+)